MEKNTEREIEKILYGADFMGETAEIIKDKIMHQVRLAEGRTADCRTLADSVGNITGDEEYAAQYRDTAYKAGKRGKIKAAGRPDGFDVFDTDGAVFAEFLYEWENLYESAEDAAEEMAAKYRKKK